MKPHEYKMVYCQLEGWEDHTGDLLGVMEWAQFDTHADVTLLP